MGIFAEVILPCQKVLFSVETKRPEILRVGADLGGVFWKIVQGSSEFLVESHHRFLLRKHFESREYIDFCLSMKGEGVYSRMFLFPHEFPVANP